MNVSQSYCTRSHACVHLPLSLVFVFALGFATTLNFSSAEEFVLLSNGNVIRGKATVIGSHVSIDRGDGNELKLAARQVMFSAPTLSDLYRYRQQQQQHQHPHVESFQDDARWCFRHQLLDEMKLALDAADAIDPSHPETLRLRRQLASIASRSAISEPTMGDLKTLQSAPSPGRAVISLVPQKTMVSLVEDATEAELAKANLSFQAVSYFNSRVQPLLINRCGNVGCHRSPSDTSWSLTHMGSHIRPPSRMTKLNLLATLSIVNRAGDQPSDLLKYATTAHGGKNDAPLKRGDDSTVETLNEWVKEVSRHEVLADSNPLAEFPENSSNKSPVDMEQTRSSDSSAMPAPLRQVTYLEGEVPLAFDNVAKRISASSPSLDSESKVNHNRPTRLPTVENPFDPEIFNRSYREGAITNNRDK